jgi:hypothetical protein
MAGETLVSSSKSLRDTAAEVLRNASTFISLALSRRVNIKWLAEYCRTSVAMIEKHYGRYINSDSEEQLKRVFEGQAGTFAGTLARESYAKTSEVVDNVDEEKWSGRVDLNHRLHGPEPCALPS